MSKANLSLSHTTSKLLISIQSPRQRPAAEKTPTSLPEAVDPLPPHPQYNRAFKEGFLVKCATNPETTPNTSKNWTKRWFVLQEHSIFYFKQGHEEPYGKIPAGDIKFASVGEINKTIKWQHSFKLVTESRTYILYAESPQECMSWIEAVMAIKNFHCLHSLYEAKVGPGTKAVTAVEQYRWNVLSDVKFVIVSLQNMIGILRRAANFMKDTSQPRQDELFCMCNNLQDCSVFYLQTIYSHTNRPFDPTSRLKFVEQTKDLVRRFQRIDSSNLLGNIDKDAINALLLPLKPKIFHIGQLVLSSTLDLFDELKYMAETIRQILTQFNETLPSEENKQVVSGLACRLTALAKEYNDDVFSTRDPVFAVSGVQICKLVERAIINKDMMARLPETKEELLNEARDISRRIEKVLNDCLQPEVVEKNRPKGSQLALQVPSLSTRNLLGSRLDFAGR